MREQWLFWQTRTLASFIAATVPVERGKDNPLMDAAQAIGGPRTEDGTGEGQLNHEPARGSYEALMEAFRPR